MPEAFHSRSTFLPNFFLSKFLKILNKEITTPGVQIPITKEVYEPILKELEEHGITFKETERKYLGYNPDGVSA